MTAFSAWGMSRKGLLLSTILVTFFALAPNLSSTSSESDFLNSSSSLGNKIREETQWRGCGFDVPLCFGFRVFIYGAGQRQKKEGDVRTVTESAKSGGLSWEECEWHVTVPVVPL